MQLTGIQCSTMKKKASYIILCDIWITSLDSISHGLLNGTVKTSCVLSAVKFGLVCKIQEIPMNVMICTRLLSHIETWT